MTDSSRRQFLTSALTTATIGLAGCSNIFNPKQNNSSNNTSNPSAEQPVGTEEIPDINYPEDGYLNKTTGKVKDGELGDDAHPVEYLLAADESYQKMGEVLQRSFDFYQDIINGLNRDDTNYDAVKEDRALAAYWAGWAHFFCDQTIDLLQEIEERAAITLVQETTTLIEDEYKPFVGEYTEEFISRYERGDLGYVAEHKEELYNQFQNYRAEVSYWGEVVQRIDTTKYPGYGN